MPIADQRRRDRLPLEPLLSVSVEAFDRVSVGAFAGSLFGVLALVAVPVLLLGAVSPWTGRLTMDRVELGHPNDSNELERTLGATMPAVLEWLVDRSIVSYAAEEE
jgi:hypothetical protein